MRKIFNFQLEDDACSNDYEGYVNEIHDKQIRSLKNQYDFSKNLIDNSKEETIDYVNSYPKLSIDFDEQEKINENEIYFVQNVKIKKILKCYKKK